MTVLDHPIWKYIRPFITVNAARENIDVREIPDDLRDCALDIVVNCAACGKVIHPFRVRAKSDRARIADSAEERRLFYAGTCPSERDPGCSRTTAAREHKDFMLRNLKV
jgi:hypothetical protein